jgi:hypothetical protein
VSLGDALEGVGAGLGEGRVTDDGLEELDALVAVAEAREESPETLARAVGEGVGDLVLVGDQLVETAVVG